MPKNMPEEIAERTFPPEFERAKQRLDKETERLARSEGFGATRGARALQAKHLSDFTTAIDKALGEKVTRAHSRVVAKLRELDSESLALCILNAALHSIWAEQKYPDALRHIGSEINAEYEAQKFREYDPESAEAIEKRVIEKPNIKWRRSAFRSAAIKTGYTPPVWLDNDKIRAGEWAVHQLCVAFPEVFRTEKTTRLTEIRGIRQPITNNTLTLTQDGSDFIRDVMSQLIERNPVWLPKVDPPLPWTKFDVGGTADKRLSHSLRVMRTQHKQTRKEVRGAIDSGSMQPTLDAVNKLQAVPWRINEAVLSVINAFVTTNTDVAGLSPPDVMETEPELPTERSSKKEWAKYFQHINTLRADKAERIAKQTLLRADLETAQELAKQPRFYTMMNLDWRGRVYGVPSFNFQREDRVRALFLFADGEPIGEEGIYWLKVHVANCGDFNKISKRPFAERVQWVDDHIAKINSVAERPLADLWWIRGDNAASKPFQFLAACLALSEAVKQGPSCCCNLPVAFDGSCNGLQHLCAMMRAPAREASLVNLTPCDAPQDVYQEVADLVKEKIDAEVNSPGLNDRDRQCARMWLDHGITRSEVKRNVMTYSYGSTIDGMTDQLREDLMEKYQRQIRQGKRDVHPFGADEGFRASWYLANHVFHTVEDVMPSAAVAMRFIRKLTSVVTSENKPLRWTTPTGLPWVNRYHEPKRRTVRLRLHTVGVSLPKTVEHTDGYETKIGEEAARDALDGAAPNFVHALDAAHLMLTVNAAAAAGITNVATVHDSYSCLPSQAARFRWIIRERFVWMYRKHDVLQEVYDRAFADLSDPNNKLKLPAVPKSGPLDIEAVRDAEFAFA